MEIKRTSSVRFIEDRQEVGDEMVKLVEAAEKAMSRAYAPYSNFHVGAALLLSNGKIVQGNNQENAAYPSGLCAERVALFHAGSQFPDEQVLALAITVEAKGNLQPLEDMVSPCGACLQVMSETEKRQEKPIAIYVAKGKSLYKAKGVAQFLPFQFSTKL